MTTITSRTGLQTGLLALCATALMTTTVFAQDLQMWVRESAADPGQIMVDLWNATHDAQIELTAIPDTQLVTNLATSARAGNAPDLVSFDLIYMPDFMRAGLLVDITDQVGADPNYEHMAQAYKDIATYEDRIYGVGFTPDVSILAWNKELFRQAGLDPEVPPRTIYEIHEMARQIAASGDDTYGFYFAGSCQGCNIFVTSPLMVAGGAHILPTSGDDDALEGEAIREVLDVYRQMWEEGLIPESAEVDTGAQFVGGFTAGNVGIAGLGGFLISLAEREFPELDYGIALLPGLEEGQVSSFVGGDVVAIPAGTPNEELAREFIAWAMSDEAQLEGMARNFILPTRTDLDDNEYFQGSEAIRVTAEALAVGYTPWAFRFNDMVNSDSSPWINMIQRAVFDGEVDEAIEEARETMLQIASE